MQRLYVLFVLLLITPLYAGATGFAKESLFLSKSPVTEGEAVFIHSVVANDNSAAFSGEVVFRDGETKIGGVAVTLAPGEAQAVSVSWQPATDGSHRIVAELTNTDGLITESESATFIIQKKEVATETSGVESSEQLQEVIAGISPQVASASAPVFSTIDNLRQKGVDALTEGESWAKAKKRGEVAGESDEKEGIVATATGLVATLLLYVFSALKFLLSNAALFYPVLALAFLYFLWRVFKKMRRPRYS